MFSAAVFADLAQLFASLSRSWVIGCAVASGCPEPLHWYLRQHLQDGFSWVRWRRVTYSGFALTSGVRQGDPLSGTSFLLAVDGWLRFVVIRLGRDIHFIMFADDLTMVVKTLESLKECAIALSLLEAVAGLGLNWDKTKVLPRGVASMDEFSCRLRTSLTSSWVHVSIVESLRFLGYKVGRGGIEMDCYAAEKILARAQAIPLMKLASAGNAFLGNVVAFSCAWHVLQDASPSTGLRRHWRSAVSKLIPGGSDWLGDALYLVKELLGWPASLHHIDINSSDAKLRTLLKKVSRYPNVVMLLQWQRQGRLHASQLHGWRRQGCLSSLVGICNLAQQPSLVSVRMSELDVQLLLPWPSIRTQLRRAFLPSIEAALRFLWARALPLLENEPLARQYATHRFMDQCLKASKLIAKFGPAAAVAFARLLLDGVPRYSHCRFTVAVGVRSFIPAII
eukprot:3014871-Amphidinium_carterae.1